MTKSTNGLAILLLLAPILAACSENIDNRQDRRDGRHDCRQEEGVVGGDKRDCKQDERAADAVS